MNIIRGKRRGEGEKRLGANPWPIGAPAPTPRTVVVDIANTAVAWGKIHLARDRGKSIPGTWAMNSGGRVTTDASEAIHSVTAYYVVSPVRNVARPSTERYRLGTPLWRQLKPVAFWTEPVDRIELFGTHASCCHVTSDSERAGYGALDQHD